MGGKGSLGVYLSLWVRVGRPSFSKSMILNVYNTKILPFSFSVTATVDDPPSLSGGQRTIWDFLPKS